MIWLLFTIKPSDNRCTINRNEFFARDFTKWKEEVTKQRRETETGNTCEECKDCEHSYQPLETDIFHSLYQDQVAKGTHSDHLSVGQWWNSISKLLIGKGTHVLDILEIKETLVRGNVTSKKNKETNIRKNLMGHFFDTFSFNNCLYILGRAGGRDHTKVSDLHFTDLLSQGLKANLSKRIYFGIKDNHDPSKG